MPVHLTETAITRAIRQAADTGARRDLSDGTLPGLRLRLTPNGKKTWVLACRDSESRMRRFPLGEHPAIGISEARDKARQMREAVRKGADPVADARRRRAIARDAKLGIGTLAALIELYGDQQGKKLKSWPESRRRMESVFAKLLGRPLATMKLGDLQSAADAWPSQQSAAAAVRYIRPILKWAAHRESVSPELVSLAPPATVGRRDRVLSREELAALLPALARSTRPYAACMCFMVLTLARREEASAACWRDIDMEAATWTIPATKNGQPHIVPLSRQALALVRDRLNRDGEGRVLKPRADALLFATATGKPLGNWDRETKVIMAESGTAGWTRHDLRRTGATMLGNMGELPDIIEAALNHVAIRSQLAATYNRSRYRPQVAAALSWLGDALDGIEAGTGATVISIRRAG